MHSSDMSHLVSIRTAGVAVQRAALRAYIHGCPAFRLIIIVDDPIHAFYIR